MPVLQKRPAHPDTDTEPEEIQEPQYLPVKKQYVNRGEIDQEARDRKLHRREQRTHANMLRVYDKCADVLRRLYLPVGHPLRHPDADKTWSECSMQVRAALALAKAQADQPHAALFLGLQRPLTL